MHAPADARHDAPAAPGWAVGVDVGGTFTDLAALDAAGGVHTRKVLSTPADQSAGVARALAALGATPADVRRVAHGTTVVTNLQRSAGAFLSFSRPPSTVAILRMPSTIRSCFSF